MVYRKALSDSLDNYVSFYYACHDALMYQLNLPNNSINDPNPYIMINLRVVVLYELFIKLLKLVKKLDYTNCNGDSRPRLIKFVSNLLLKLLVLMILIHILWSILG